MVLTVLSQDKVATCLGAVARLIHRVDSENIIGHESSQGHVACVPHMRGVVARPVQVAGGFHVLQLLEFILPSGTEWPVTAEDSGAQHPGPGSDSEHEAERGSGDLAFSSQSL